MLMIQLGRRRSLGTDDGYLGQMVVAYYIYLISFKTWMLFYNLHHKIPSLNSANPFISAFIATWRHYMWCKCCSPLMCFSSEISVWRSSNIHRMTMPSASQEQCLSLNRKLLLKVGESWILSTFSRYFFL